MRFTLPFVMAGLAMAAVSAGAQDAGQRIVRRDAVRAGARAYQGRDARVSIDNVAGNIVVTGGSGDEVSIEAVKRTRGDRGELAKVRITVDERAGRVDVRTEGEQNRGWRGSQVSVDYTVTVPASASVDLHSVSGSMRVTGVRGSLRAETVSGNVTTTDTPKLEVAKSISGDVSLTGAAAEGDLSAASVSGSVTARGLKAHGLDLGSISGDIMLSDVTCDRLGIKSVSGSVEYAGSLVKGGRYEINSHSGSVRLTLSNPPGFELAANSFSGTIRSDFPMIIGGDRDRDRGRRRGGNNRSIRATFGDGSATVTVRTFSGEIVIAKR